MLKVGPTAKRLKVSAGSHKPAPRSKEPEPRAKTLALSVADVASGNVNYAAEVAGTSYGTAAAKRGATSIDRRVSAGTSQLANAAGNLDTVSEEMTAEHGAISRDPRVKAGMGTAVNSVVTRATAGREGPSPMEQETAPGERINKTRLFVTGVVNVRLFLKWLKE